MPFNSFQFLLFVPAVWLVFLAVGTGRRWMVLLAASWIFYAALDVPYLLGVLALVTLATYGFGLWMGRTKTPGSKRLLLTAGVGVNLLILVAMKYMVFLADNLRYLSAWLGFHSGWIHPGKVLVAIGVSYYVFQAIAYLADIYLELAEPEPHLGYFALYLSFFPKLLQGPIERPGELLPQLRTIQAPAPDRFRSGMWLIVRGLFKKMILADRIGLVTSPVFADVHGYSGFPLFLAIYAYAFQIYFDFSGYTDIALGTARLFNIDLVPNFNSPYAACSIADFWRRWHMSFSRWILDYIFKPLQIQWRDGRKAGTAAALMVTFLVSGAWHGASWGFLTWGGLHGLYLACAVYYKPYQQKWHRILDPAKTGWLRPWSLFLTFNLVCFAWIFFRANTMGDAGYILSHLFQGSSGMANLLDSVRTASESGTVLQESIVLGATLAVLALVDAHGKRHRLLDVFYARPPWIRFIVYYAVIMYLMMFGLFTKQAFAYMRF